MHSLPSASAALIENIPLTHWRQQCSARALGMLSATGRRDGSNKSGPQASGCLDLLNEQRHRELQVFPIDPTEDSAQQCTGPATNIYRKANRRLTGIRLRENVVVKNL